MQTNHGGLRVALVGLGFGAEFAPIYRHHPDVADLLLCDPRREKLDEVAGRYEIPANNCLGDLEDVLASREIDAVHLVTPIPLHAEQAIRVLESGKHCACTVPMATDLVALHALVAAQARSRRNYMMMETAVYTREFLFVQDLLTRGEMGRIQFLRGAHYQDMEGWPPYWAGLPPMWYATHAIAPLLRLAGTRAERVHCFGSGTIREELRAQYNNPYPAETAIFRLQGTDAAAEVTRTLFETARDYSESFQVLGDRTSFEWQQIEREEPVLFRLGPLAQGRGRATSAERVTVPDFAERLPEPIRRFTRRGVYDESRPHLSFLQGGGHGGSHPHLVHEFVRSIVEGRPAAIDAVTAADWTAPGICAHASALNGGAAVEIPAFAP